MNKVKNKHWYEKENLYGVGFNRNSLSACWWDMHYNKHPLENYYSPIPIIGKYSEIHDQLPCWGLSSLLEILPPGKILLHDKGGLGYKCICNNIDTDFHDNPVDACFEMIVELNELKMLQL